MPTALGNQKKWRRRKRGNVTAQKKKGKKKKCGDWMKLMCKCTWAFLSIKKKCIPHLVFFPFWGENILVVDPGRKHSDPTIFFPPLPPTKHPQKCFLSYFLSLSLSLSFCGNTIFVSTFSPHFHFHPYFLILPHLVPKIKRRSHFCPHRHLTNGNSLRGKRSALLAH